MPTTTNPAWMDPAFGTIPRKQKRPNHRRRRKPGLSWVQLVLLMLAASAAGIVLALSFVWFQAHMLLALPALYAIAAGAVWRLRTVHINQQTLHGSRAFSNEMMHRATVLTLILIGVIALIEGVSWQQQLLLSWPLVVAYVAPVIKRLTLAGWFVVIAVGVLVGVTTLVVSVVNRPPEPIDIVDVTIVSDPEVETLGYYAALGAEALDQSPEDVLEDLQSLNPTLEGGKLEAGQRVDLTFEYVPPEPEEDDSGGNAGGGGLILLLLAGVAFLVFRKK